MSVYAIKLKMNAPCCKHSCCKFVTIMAYIHWQMPVLPNGQPRESLRVVLATPSAGSLHPVWPG